MWGAWQHLAAIGLADGMRPDPRCYSSSHCRQNVRQTRTSKLQTRSSCTAAVIPDPRDQTPDILSGFPWHLTHESLTCGSRQPQDSAPVPPPPQHTTATPPPRLHQPPPCTCTRRGRGLLPNSPLLDKIASPNSTRLPSNIPLRTFSAHQDRHPRHDREHSSWLLTPHGHGHGHPADDTGYSASEDDGSEGSSWTDTGDIGEQLAEDDPLRERLNETLDDEILAGALHKRHPKQHHRRQKQVRYREPLSSGSSRSASRHAGAISKEAIHIPSVAHRKVTRAERLLAAIMAGGSSSIHGLTGKPLLFVEPTISVCLVSRMLTLATAISPRFLYH